MAITNADIGDVGEISRSCLAYEKYVSKIFGRTEVFRDIVSISRINSISAESELKSDCTIEMFFDEKSNPSSDSEVSPSENLETFASNVLRFWQKFLEFGKLMYCTTII